MIKVKTFVFNPFQVNSYIVNNHDGEAYIIDAACSDNKEREQLLHYIEKQEIRIKALINTHCHVDHLLGIEYLRKRLEVPFYCCEDDQFLINTSVAQGNLFGLSVEEPSNPDQYIHEKDLLSIGDQKIKIFHVPGHSPGSLVFYFEEDSLLFTGDVLFLGSIGRTDLPGGDYHELIEGIRGKLLSLDDQVTVFPGHGPTTTIGQERRFNPFLQGGF